MKLLSVNKADYNSASEISERGERKQNTLIPRDSLHRPQYVFCHFPTMEGQSFKTKGMEKSQTRSLDYRSSRSPFVYIFFQASSGRETDQNKEFLELL